MPQWFVPGGAIEPGESPSEAAIRETFEETGHRIYVDASRELVLRYPFEWNGTPFDCTTHFFPATLIDPDAPPAPVNDASYHEGVSWIPLSALEPALSWNGTLYAAVTSLL